MRGGHDGLAAGPSAPAYLMVVAMISFCVDNTLMATIPVNQINWKQKFLSIIIALWGMDMSFTTATVILSDHEGPNIRALEPP